MKRYILIVISALVVSAVAEPDVVQFVSGENVAYSTEAHPKSEGIVIKMSYPLGWEAKEGQGPHIIQKFISDRGKGKANATILSRPIPEEWTQEVRDVAFSEDGVEDLLDGIIEGSPEGSKAINAKATKIEGIPAAMLEFSTVGERLGIVARSRTLMCMFCFKDKLVSISFSVGSVAAEDDLDKMFEENRTLFMAIANTVSIPEKWK